MFNRNDKIIKKENISELEQEVAKKLGEIENQNKTHANLVQFQIIRLTSVTDVEYEQQDGTNGRYMLIRIPHRSLQAFRKVGHIIQERLEEDYQRPVIVVANRNIQSPTGKLR